MSSWARLLSRFAGVGVLATITYLVVVNLLFIFSSLPAAWASVVAYLVGMVVSYVGQSKFTFGKEAVHSKQIIKFIIMSCIGLLVSYFVVELATNFRESYLPFAAIVVAVIVPITSFFMMKFWVFVEGGQKTE